MPLGEAAKGSGQCNAGSGVGPLVGSSPCEGGGLANACATGIEAAGCVIGSGNGSGP
jgi:hypothetical protein